MVRFITLFIGIITVFALGGCGSSSSSADDNGTGSSYSSGLSSSEGSDTSSEGGTDSASSVSALWSSSYGSASSAFLSSAQGSAVSAVWSSSEGSSVSAARSSSEAGSLSSSDASLTSSVSTSSSSAASTSSTSATDGDFAPEPVSGDLLRELPDSIDVSDVFEHGIPIVERFTILRSDKAVTVRQYSATTNLNHDQHGRYLVVNSQNDPFTEILIDFDAQAISSALAGVDFGDILEAKLYLWNESGQASKLKLWRFDDDFNEDVITTSGSLGSINPTAQPVANVSGDIGWKSFTLPRDILQEWLDAPDQPHGVMLEPLDTSYLRFSSDETTRAPALVISYRERSLVPSGLTTVEEALGTDTDNEQCSVFIHADFAGALREGDDFSLQIKAKDNEELDYYRFRILRDIGSMTGAREAYIYNQGHRELSYDVSGTINGDASTPDSHLLIDVWADDKSGLAPICHKHASIPIFKNDKPVIDSSIEYLDVVDVRPNFYRLIKNDRQRILIRAAAEDDSDDISYMELWLPGDTAPRIYPGNSLEHTWTNVSGVSGLSDFNYTIRAVDTTGSASTYTSDPVPIRDWNELKLYNHALTFLNFGRETDMSKTYLKYIYGVDEVTGRLGNYTLKAKEWYSKLKDIATGGSCYGMSTTSIALTTGGESLEPANLDPGAASTAELDPPTDLVKVFVYAKQGSQLSKLVLEETYAYHNNHQDDLHFTLHKVLNTLNDEMSHYGSLAIFNGDTGHSIVPWMARQYPNGDWKVYVYDSNKIEGVSAIQKGLGEPSMGYMDDFPYVEFNLSTDSWRYLINSVDDDVPDYWNEDIFFNSHRSIVGNNAYNDIRSHLQMRDHTLPSVLRSIWESLSGQNILSTETNDNIVLRIEDDDGNSVLKSEKFGGNGAVPIRTLSGTTSSAGLYLIPGDKPMTIKVYGEKSGEYALKLLAGHLVVSIEGKHIEGQLVDTYAFTPDPDDPDSIKLEILSATANDPFVIRASFGYAKAREQEIVSAEKTYQFSHIKLGENMPMDITFERYAETLIVHSEEKSGFAFDLTVEETDENGDLATVYAGSITPAVVSGGPVFDFNLTRERQ